MLPSYIDIISHVSFFVLFFFCVCQASAAVQLFYTDLFNVVSLQDGGSNISSKALFRP